MRKIIGIPAVVLFIAMAAKADTREPADAGRGTIDEDPNMAIPAPALKPPTIEGEGVSVWPRSDVTVEDWFAASVQRAEARAKGAEARARTLSARLKANERASAEAKSLADGYQSNLMSAEDEVRGLRDKLNGTEGATQVAIDRYKGQLRTTNAQEQVIKNLTASLTERIKFGAELNGQTALIVVLGFFCFGLWLNQRGNIAKLLRRIPDEESRALISRLEQELKSTREWLANADATGNEILRELQAKEETIKRIQASGRGVLRDNEELLRKNNNLLAEIVQLREALGMANSSIELLGGEPITVPSAVNEEPEIVIVHHEPQDPPLDLPAPIGEVPPDPSAPKSVDPETEATTRIPDGDEAKPAGAEAEPPIQQPAPDASPEPLIDPNEAATRRLFGSDSGSAEKILKGRSTLDGYPVPPPPVHEEAKMGDEGCNDGPGARH
jgi:hypothetical protein